MADKHKILITDDEPDIREVLKILLSSEGYEVEEAGNGREAIEKLKKNSDTDLLIMDIMMPEMTGIEACSELRKFSSVPVLFLTAKSQDRDKVTAYTQGGDDYLVKPFSHTELLMKVKSLLRRYKEYNSAGYSGGEETLTDKLKVNEKTRTVTRDGEAINLTEKEYDILRYFLSHRGQIVETKDLYEGVWEEQYLPSAANTIMVHVLNLRKKIEEDVNSPQIIKTVWGKGYRID